MRQVLLLGKCKVAVDVYYNYCTELLVLPACLIVNICTGAWWYTRDWLQ